MNRIFNDLIPIPGRKTVILFSHNSLPSFSSTSIGPVQAMRASINMYQAGLPGWRRDWADFVEQTGGYAIKARTDEFTEITQILQDQDHYYMLGYVPDAETLDIKQTTIQTGQGPRQSYKLESHLLKVKTKGSKVRTRAGFSNVELISGSASSNRFRPSSTSGMITSSPFVSGDLKITTEAMSFYSPTGDSIIRITLHLDVKDLAFAPRFNENQSIAEVSITGRLAIDGRTVNTYKGNASFTAPLQAYKKSIEKDFTSTFDIPAAGPGLYELRTSVFQPQAARIGNESILVEVPDFTRSGLVTSGIATFNSSEESEVYSDERPITRRVSRTDAFGCSLYVYNAERDKSNGKARIESQYRLYRDDKLVQASEVLPVLDIGGRSTSDSIPVQFDIDPSPELTAGNYLLEVLVVDRLAGNKKNTAAQSVAIELLE